MKAMKGLSMNKMLGSIKRRPTAAGPESSTVDLTGPPEEVAVRCVRLFCETGGSSATGDEVTYLPPIVESAESSPAAAAECARTIRKLLNRDYWSKPSYQYNAVMLMRILSDNPGQTFTRNLDKKFVDVTKDLLRGGRDPSVHQLLTETLETFESTKSYDEGLGLIIEMWRKEKSKMPKDRATWPSVMPPLMQMPTLSPQQNYYARDHSSHTRKLPDPVDLSNRLEEARTSAKLLEQMVAGTPPAEVLSNDLLPEFAERCQRASASIQGYMNSTDPAPDNDTMENLIDTNEHLQQALNQHQRAVLNAKKRLGVNEGSNNSSPKPSEDFYEGAHPPARQNAQGSSSRSNLVQSAAERIPASSNGKGKATAGSWGAAGPSRSANGKSREEPDVDGDQDDGDPFRDPMPEPSRGRFGGGGAASSSSLSQAGQRAAGLSDSGPDRFQMHGASGSQANAGEDEDPYGTEDAYRADPKKDPVYRY